MFSTRTRSITPCFLSCTIVLMYSRNYTIFCFLYQKKVFSREFSICSKELDRVASDKMASRYLKTNQTNTAQWIFSFYIAEKHALSRFRTLIHNVRSWQCFLYSHDIAVVSLLLVNHEYMNSSRFSLSLSHMRLPPYRIIDSSNALLLLCCSRSTLLSPLQHLL